jgi:hypothetical protein
MGMTRGHKSMRIPANPGPLVERAQKYLEYPELDLTLKELRLAGATVSTKLYESVINVEGSRPMVTFISVELDGSVYEVGVCPRGFWLWKDNTLGWLAETDEFQTIVDFLLTKIRE